VHSNTDIQRPALLRPPLMPQRSTASLNEWPEAGAVEIRCLVEHRLTLVR
jgi:hypothetical protein